MGISEICTNVTFAHLPVGVPLRCERPPAPGLTKANPSPEV